MRNLSHQIAARLLIAYCVGVAALSGCATTPVEAPAAPLVFPSPPAEPRFFFERSLRFNDNVQQPAAADKFKRFISGGAKEVRGLVKPFDVAAYHGRIYVTDSIQKLVVLFDIPGGRYVEFGNSEPAALDKPTGITVSSAGEVFVADTGAQKIRVYSGDGIYLRSIGDAQSLQRPSDVAVDVERNRLYVVDAGGVESQQHGVKVFDLTTGEPLQFIGKRGTEPGDFNLPLQAALDNDGNLYVVDSGNFRVEGFAPDNKLIVNFGSLGRYPGQFARPKGIATDPLGNIYVVDSAFGNFQIFDPNGQLLLFIGKRGEASRPANYMLPAGIAVDYDGRVYVVDQFFRKIDVFRPAALEREQGFTALPPQDDE